MVYLHVCSHVLSACSFRCTSFTASEGAAYCRANGMTAVSLDSAAKEREFGSLLTRYCAIKFKWHHVFCNLLFIALCTVAIL